MSIKSKNNFFAAWARRGRAIVAALFVGFITSCNDNPPNNPDVVVSPVTPVSPPPSVVVSPVTPVSPSPNVATDASPITDVVVVVTTPDKQSLVNRQVQLTDVQVQSVVGDRTFWVGPSNTQQLLVVLDEALDTTRVDKKLDINTGQTVTLSGLLRTLPSMDEAQKLWGLSATETEPLKNQEVYLQAQQVQIQ